MAFERFREWFKAIPNITSKNFLATVKEILEIGIGYRPGANPDHRWVTIKDLFDPSIVSYLSDKTVSVVNSEAVKNGGVLPKPPTNLMLISQANPNRAAAFATHLTWTLPEDSTISHTEVWRNTDNNRAEAKRIGIVTYPQNEYVDQNPDPQLNYYYWIRTIGWNGLYSSWEPGAIQGGFVVYGTETVGETIDNIIETLSGGDAPLYNSATAYVINDRVRYQGSDGNFRSYICVQACTGETPEDNTTYWKRESILSEGDINGETVVGIDGNMVVKDSILARHIKADNINGSHIHSQSFITLAEGGRATFGDSNVVIDTSTVGNTDGRIIVAPDGGAIPGNDYCVLDNGDINFYLADGSQHYPYKALKRMEFGQIYANGSNVVNIPGYWKNIPAVMISPASIPIYNSAVSSSSQELVCEPGNVSLQSGQTRKYKFTPTVQLRYLASNLWRSLTNSGSYEPPPDALPTTLVTDIVAMSSTTNLRKITVQIGMKGVSEVGPYIKKDLGIYPLLQVYLTGTGWVDAAYGAPQTSHDNWVYWTITTVGYYGADLTHWRISWWLYCVGSTVDEDRPDCDWVYQSETRYYPTTVIQSGGVVNWMAVGE